MGLLVKARTTTITEATLHLKGGMKKENPIELTSSMLPAEWFPQSGVQITWPHSETDWKPWLEEVTEFYIRLAYHISSQEQLIIATPTPQLVEELLKKRLPTKALDHIRLFECPTNDTWTRDHGLICVRQDGKWLLKDFCFNGWGNKFSSEKDNQINAHLCKTNWLNGTYSNCNNFILEGGSIESDGRGTLLTTSCCLLNPNRNPHLSQQQIEERLCKEFFLKRILWLHHGSLEGDDTDGHIDTLARFCPNDTIVYVSCNDPNDSHYEELHLMEEELKSFRTLEDQPYNLVGLPMPRPIVEDGERLPATYANFLITNNEVLLPTYRQPDRDEEAARILQEVFPERAIVPIDSYVLIRQHGSLHCSTMQLPKGIVK